VAACVNQQSQPCKVWKSNTRPCDKASCNGWWDEKSGLARATRTARTPIWTAQNKSWHRLFHVLESKREFCFSCQIPFSHATISSSLNLFKHLPNSARPCVKARNIDEHYLLQAWILWKLLEANLKGLQTPATHSYTATLLYWMPMLGIDVHPLANLIFPKTSTLCVPRGSLKQLQAIIMKICDFPSCQRLSSSVIDLKVLIVSARPKQLKVSYSS